MSEKLIEERIADRLRILGHVQSVHLDLLREAEAELRRLRAELKKFAGTEGTTDWWCNQW